MSEENNSLKRPAVKENDSCGDNKKPRVSGIFDGFTVQKVLNEDSDKKMMIIQGRYENAMDKDAVVILEKKPFGEENVKQILSADTSGEMVLQNDIYGTHELYPLPHCNGIKSSLIYPATESHIAKYTRQEMRLVRETAEDYEKITLPHIQGSKFSTKWVDNILEKKTESERIVFEDPDEENGFILLPDMKWDGKLADHLYLVAIVHKSGIKSLRDLTTEHLPLLHNIHDKATKAIMEKYSLGSNRLRIFLHYQPSYYHLHVHITHLQHDVGGNRVERAHLLSDVIQNIELCPDYYQRATLVFPARLTDKLYLAFKEAGKC